MLTVCVLKNIIKNKILILINRNTRRISILIPKINRDISKNIPVSI